jgi:tight adherence protein B
LTELQIALLTAGCVFLTLQTLMTHVGRRREEVRQRLQSVAARKEAAMFPAADEKKAAGALRLPATLHLTGLQRMLDATEQELAQADIPLRAGELVALQMAAVVLFPLLSLYYFGSFVLAMIMAFSGAALPVLLVRNSKLRRRRKFSDQLGEALPVMSSSLRAGFSLLQTLDAMQQEAVPPLAGEFRQTLREIKYGLPTEEALKNMARRVRCDDLDLVITAINIQHQVGGNLAEVLDNITHTIRERIRIKGEVRTLTAQGRISGTIVALLPLALAAFLMIVNPTYLSVLFRHPLGLTLTGAAIVSGVVGAILIKKIVNIEY